MFLNFCVLNIFELMVLSSFNMFSPSSHFFYKKFCYQVVTNRITCYFVSLAQSSTHVNYITRPKIKIGIFIFGMHQSLIIFLKYNGSSNKSITKQNKKLKVSSHLNYVNRIMFTLITIIHGKL
jgi:hypothetical protein